MKKWESFALVAFNAMKGALPLWTNANSDIQRAMTRLLYDQVFSSGDPNKTGYISSAAMSAKRKKNKTCKDLRIIHPWFEYSQRMFRSRSEEILSVSTECHVFSGRKEVPFDTVVCLIKVDVIYLNLTLINFVERVVGSKDQRRTIVLPAKVIEIYDCINFSGSKVCSLTTVNVQNLNIFNVNVLKELRTELFCQENTRSNYNNSRNIKSINSINGVSDHAHCLTTTSGYNDLSTIVFKHCVTCFTLMGTELHNLVSMNV